MEYNRYSPISSFLFFDPFRIPATSSYNKVIRDKEIKQLSDTLYSSLLSNPPKKEKFLEPIVIFHNEARLTKVETEKSQQCEDTKEFYVSLGIFNLDTTSATATITKDNKLEVAWEERAGKGRFTSKIPSHLVATSEPVLSYEGGVLHIKVPVKSKGENEALFVGKLESKS